MQKITNAYAFGAILLSFTSSMPALAQHTARVSHVLHTTQLQFTPPPLPPTGTPVGRRRGAAGRGGGHCTFVSPLTALVPATEQTLVAGKATYVWGKTSTEYPTFWYYVPESRQSLSRAEFVLQDEQNNDVYRSNIRLPDTPGVVSLRLPAHLTPLKTNQKYRWFFKIAGEVACTQQNSYSVKDSVEGWVERVKLDPMLVSQLQVATPRQRVALYAKNGLWYDALTALAELQQLNPEDATLKAEWYELLQSIGLSHIATKPIVSCCNLK